MNANKTRRRLLTCLLAAVMMTALAWPGSRAASPPSGVYFTAVNDQPMDLTADTMPFWSNGTLYVSSRLFEGTDAGVTYARNDSLGLAILYNSQADLRFDLLTQTCYDRQGTVYSGYAIEQNGVTFFPLALVCRYFGLTWTYNETSIAPLIRVTNANVILDDQSYIDAASSMMVNMYNAYLKTIAPLDPPDDPPEPPAQDPVQAAEGQKVYLLADCASAQEARDLLPRLEGVQATFLLDLTAMEDADLLRGLVAGGHGVALRCEGSTGEAVRGELEAARERLWNACRGWLELVWYEGEVPVEALLRENACVRVTAELDRRDTGLDTAAQAGSLLQAVGRYREDLAVCLDAGRLGGLESLLDGLEEGRYRLCAWRLTA